MIAPLKKVQVNTVPIIKDTPGTLKITGEISCYYEDTELFEKYFGTQKKNK